MAVRFRIYRTYRFIDKDPMTDALRTIAKDEGVTPYMGHQLSGVAAATIENWFDGNTKKPQNATSTAFAASLGYVRHDRLRPDGTVDVAFDRARRLDYRDEIVKQANFLLRTGRQKKKRTNGK